MNAQNIPKFEFQKPNLEKPNVGNYLSDMFLGTNTAQNIAANNNLAMQQAFNQQAMNSANQFNKYMWDQQAAFNKDLYNQTMKYNKYQSETQYQRAMEDMKKAGINPLIAFNNGAAANSVGNSAMGSVGGSASSTAQSGKGETVGFNIMNGLLGQATAKMVNAFSDSIVDKMFPGKKIEKFLDKLL